MRDKWTRALAKKAILLSGPISEEAWGYLDGIDGRDAQDGRSGEYGHGWLVGALEREASPQPQEGP